jgi:protein-ribulosamine 3-kinase
MNDWPDILKQIQQSTGLSPDLQYIRRVSGGSINSSFVVGSDALQIFVKINHRKHLEMFKAEAAGLSAIENTGTILSPAVLCTGHCNTASFIAMRAIKLQRNVAPANYRAFGQQLAALHRCQQSRFGVNLDNTIGTTLQRNTLSVNWFKFWRTYRLGFQLKLAHENNAPLALIEDGQRLNENFEALFDAPPKASCLHGDLWRGNWGFDESGAAVVFDPAHYFGDRETDIAMTTLFGRAPADFYAAYAAAYPLREGFTNRAAFYNLYHILNHFNLFGGSYANQAHKIILTLLSELG